MNDLALTPPPDFSPVAPDASGAVTWIHIGDLHMVRTGEQNFADLAAIVDEINAAYAGKGVSFVYLPGDVADDGSRRAYAAVRECLDRLRLPWCAVVGDHDVHEKSFGNFQDAMGSLLYGAFTVGQVRFLRLNAFSEPRPDAFVVSDKQLDWAEGELKLCDAKGLRPVVLMHCYPSDLKQGGERLRELLHRYRVRLVDMGHTHYNELSNDGGTLFSATRSTGQIEEGPVGYTVITLNGDPVSWHFVRLGALPLVSITNPSDERLLPDSEAERIDRTADLQLHMRVWSDAPLKEVRASVESRVLELSREGEENLWSATIPAVWISEGEHELTATAEDSQGRTGTDTIRIQVGRGNATQRTRAAVDHENALGAWPERGILGTQLGPNKNGKKW